MPFLFHAILWLQRWLSYTGMKIFNCRSGKNRKRKRKRKPQGNKLFVKKGEGSSLESPLALKSVE